MGNSFDLFAPDSNCEFCGAMQKENDPVYIIGKVEHDFDPEEPCYSKDLWFMCQKCWERMFQNHFRLQVYKRGKRKNRCGRTTW